MVTDIWVNIDTGNDLLPDGTQLLSWPKLTYGQGGPVIITWELPQPLIAKISLKITCLKCYWNLPGDNELKSYRKYKNWYSQAKTKEFISMRGLMTAPNMNQVPGISWVSTTGVRTGGETEWWTDKADDTVHSPWWRHQKETFSA